MDWKYLDHNFWTTMVGFLAIAAAVVAAYYQYKINKSICRIQDAVEVYAYYSTMIIKKVEEKTEIMFPQIFILNVGTRIIYLDKYVFNGRIYMADGQVLPPTYSNSNALYRIDLPTNGETHVSVVIYYRDIEGRKWVSEIIAEKIHYWNVKSLAKKPD